MPKRLDMTGKGTDTKTSVVSRVKFVAFGERATAVNDLNECSSQINRCLQETATLGNYCRDVLKVSPKVMSLIRVEFLEKDRKSLDTPLRSYQSATPRLGTFSIWSPACLVLCEVARDLYLGFCVSGLSSP